MDSIGKNNNMSPNEKKYSNNNNTNISRIKLAGDVLFNFLLERYRRGIILVKLSEIEEFLVERYPELYPTKAIASYYVTYVAKRLYQKGVIVLSKEIGEKSYTASLTLNYIDSIFYGKGS
jgi:hypothetical protein